MFRIKKQELNYVLLFGAITLVLSGCSQSVSKDRSVSFAEERSLKEPPFDPSSNMSGVQGDGVDVDGDSDYPVTYRDGSADPNFIQHCTVDRYEKELEAAMQEAADDKTNNSVVIRYAYSFGAKDKFDYVARMAYERSVLRKDDDGYTPIVVDNEAGTAFKATYLTDHSAARRDYLTGSRCFFHTVKVKEKASDYKWANSYFLPNGELSFDHVKPNTPQDKVVDYWVMKAMYIGDSYACGDNCVRRYMSPRLFRTVEETEEVYRKTLKEWKAEYEKTRIKLSDYVKKCPPALQAQFIPLYMADIREGRFTIPFEIPLLDPKFTSEAIRMREYEVKIKTFLRLPLVVKHREAIEEQLGKDFESPAYQGAEPTGRKGSKVWGALEGAPQLIDNLLWSGLNATVLSFQYTPIVLDLPVGNTPAEYVENKNIRTSSPFAGAFFNLGNRVKKTSVVNGKLVEPVVDIQSPSGWVGGKLEKVRTEKFGAIDKSIYVRRATDGFMVLPTDTGKKCTDGSPVYSVSRGLQMFGAYGDLNGTTVEFENGFAKLRDYVSKTAGAVVKSCAVPADVQSGNRQWSTDELKQRYFGPWDTAAYAAVKVWTDANRNGSVDCGEMQSLAEAKIAAMNTCNIVFQQTESGQKVAARDRFGNATHLRAAFLVSPKAGVEEATVLSMLRTGKDVDGMTPEFRVGADVLFKTYTDVYLQDVEPTDIVEVKEATKATQN